MRYYSYISDAKVDMLLPQVPDGIKQTVAAELGFDLKLVKGKMKAETKTLEDRVARLAVVEKHLRKEEQLGSVLNPRKWIEGQHLMYSLDIGADAILFCMRNGDLGPGTSRFSKPSRWHGGAGERRCGAVLHAEVGGATRHNLH